MQASKLDPHRERIVEFLKHGVAKSAILSALRSLDWWALQRSGKMRLTMWEMVGIIRVRQYVHAVCRAKAQRRYSRTSRGTAKAMIADIVPESSRGTAYGTYSAVLGVLDVTDHRKQGLKYGIR